MSGAALEWDLSELEKLQNVLNKAADVSFKPLMRSLLEEVEEQSRERFVTKEGPEELWEDWSEKYKERQAKKGKNSSLLQLEGHLGGSLGYDFNGTNFYNLQGHVSLGEIYGATHQYGDEDRGIPARPVLGINTDDEAALIEIVNDFISGVI